MTRFKKAIIPVTFFLAFAAPAYAFHCPADMAEIDKALASSPMIPEGDMAKVKEFRAMGQQLHESGRHQESVDTLQKAKDLLGI
ncbi:hypothetical protein [Aliiruegeria lutimaris]|uniref:Tetratricopeptide repeat-containing protein n=1 Tax=Aliiruegeria lutimaris TaxID=571298 RepID=A0A1G8S3X2_9RHOB|nr:hypothetical protein [Aliiruegeria lutimaris]SDJ23907.1 hypothetical protein SAMN04488026_101451 [Aliiruegeria lutimaris]